MKKEIISPILPCEHCLREKGKVFEKFIIVYCQHNLSGGIFDINLQRWQVYSQVTGKDFEALVNPWLKYLKHWKEIEKQRMEQEPGLPPRLNN